MDKRLSMENIIEIKNLSFRYSDDEQYVLNNFNLSVERGSFTVILGHNGSGKSTLAKLFNGVLKPTCGTVLVNGMDTTDEKTEIEIKRNVGLVFQNPDNQLISSIVEEDVAFGPENLGLEPDIIRERVDEALKIVEMYDFRKKSPFNLSGGQKQRVAIAGILAMKPQCIVLDEPTAMLDPIGRQEVIKALIDLNKNHNITIVLITHFMEETQFADRVIVMKDGNIIDDGTPNKVFSHYDILKSAGLGIPQTTELLSILSRNGFAVNNGIISVDDCCTELLKILKK